MKKKININKKGTLSMEFAVHSIILLIVTAMIVDLIIIALSHYVMMECSNQIAKVVARQSGLEMTCPKNFVGTTVYGGTTRYYKTTDDVRTMIENVTGSMDIRNVVVNIRKGGVYTGGDIRSNDNYVYQYNDTVKVKISYDVDFKLLSYMIPGLPTSSGSVTRTAVCQYKRDYGVR